MVFGLILVLVVSEVRYYSETELKFDYEVDSEEEWEDEEPGESLSCSEVVIKISFRLFFLHFFLFAIMNYS